MTDHIDIVVIEGLFNLYYFVSASGSLFWDSESCLINTDIPFGSKKRAGLSKLATVSNSKSIDIPMLQIPR
jgi:hypothetical protein